MRMGVSLTTLTDTQVIKDYFIFDNRPTANGNWIEFIENFKSKEVNVKKIDKKVVEALEFNPEETVALCNTKIITDIYVYDEFKTNVFKKLDIHQINSVSCTKTMKTKEDYDLKTFRSFYKKHKITGSKLKINYKWKVQRFFFTIGTYLNDFKEVSLIITTKLWSFLKKEENKDKFMSLLLDYKFPEVIEIKAKESIYIDKRDLGNAAKILDKF